MSDQGLRSARRLYKKVKAQVPIIERFCTDANSCYRLLFETLPEPLTITKAETHLIESSNSSIRDNLARFNRKSKRYSKSWDMLELSLTLFFHKDLLLTKK
jgi:IS1 family transposase